MEFWNLVLPIYFLTNIIDSMKKLTLNYLKFKIREELKNKRYLDTFLHASVAIILYFILSNFLTIPRENLFFFSFLGSFFPDIDHLLLYRKNRFGNFKNFLRWIIRSERYRIGFELFHNAPTIFLLLLSLPYTYNKSSSAFSFSLAFLFHLLTDLILDKIIVGKIKWWRFGL